MKKIAGVVLIVLGVFGLAWGGFTYKTRKKLIDIGPIQASREKSHHIPVPPVAGGLALVGGIALLVIGGRD